MAIYTLTQEQVIPATLEELWDFISSPENLSKITPKYMGFHILTPDLPKIIRPGLHITYHVSPLFRIKLKWITEITLVEPLHRFVDEQRAGPYSFWRHEHTLIPIPEGVKMLDVVQYTPPLGFLGDLANGIIIRPKLDEIFAFRRQALIRIYGDAPVQATPS